MIFNFRFNYFSSSQIDRLSNIGVDLVDDLHNKSEESIVHSKTRGTVITNLFKISKSKPIIDEIDKVLAKHYGFTDEELDFIINYDIKYRMGKELSN